MKQRGKRCTRCLKDLPIENFLYCKNTLFFDEISNICTACLEEWTNQEDLNQVNKVLQYLNIPFYPDKWVQMYGIYGKKTLKNYCIKFTNKEHETVDWNFINNIWKEKQKKGKLEQSIDIVHEDQMKKWRSTWGKNFSVDQYKFLSDFYESIEKTNNIVTATQMDQVRILCLQSLRAHEKAEKGEDITKEMKVYGDIVKQAGLEPKNARNYGDFESIGELMNWLVRNDQFMPEFYDWKNRDEVDVTIQNQQAYLHRLVMGEPTLRDSVEERLSRRSIQKELEEEGFSAEDLDKYTNEGFALKELEEGDILEDYEE